jgi:signal transduction histidine kinase/CheY-like chemotaxis protein/HAMP domain-containing protein
MRRAVRLTLRAKLLAILAAVSVAIAILIVTSTLTEERVEGQLGLIAQRHVPRLELGPKLEVQLERISRGFQDAVAAQDQQRLEELHVQRDALLADLDAATTLMGAERQRPLRAAISDYFGSAYDVSRRLVAEETGEALLEAIAAMQAKHARAQALLKAATRFDQNALARAFAEAASAQDGAKRVRFAISAACLAAVLLLSLVLSRQILRAVGALSAGLARFGRGEFGQPIRLASGDEFEALAGQANQMAQNLERLRVEREQADWLKEGQAGLVHELQGDLEPRDVANQAVRFLARYLHAPAGAFYEVDPRGGLALLGSYGGAAASGQGPVQTLGPGEGLPGQALRERELSVVSSLPAGYLRVRSGLGEAQPVSVALLPLIRAGEPIGLLELALFKTWPEPFTQLLQAVRHVLAIKLEVARTRASLRDLLSETQRQAERLTVQEEELRSANEELQVQQEELRDTNAELTQQSGELERQRRQLERRNLELDQARKTLEAKNQELGVVSAYKSQFLANMSHELRTPLNSMLLLSGLLADNEAKNLSDKQVEYCKTIHHAGQDLLALINQVLDLSKVEAGKQELRVAAVELEQLAQHARRMFEPLAREKGLALHIELDAARLPKTITTDAKRVEQILNNLLGNAIKFTERGAVTLRIAPPDPGLELQREDLSRERCVTFSVIDTGIGIGAEHQDRIFAPFEQIEASQDRRYGGTGLGLTISRELAGLLGGELGLASEEQRGSTFMLHLPYSAPESAGARPARGPNGGSSALRPPTVGVEQQAAGDSEPQAVRPLSDELLIIEDNPAFAAVLGAMIQAQGFRHSIAPDGETGLRLARAHRPCGIVLDVQLSDVDGFTLMEMLRADPATATIPVHFVSSLDAPERGMALGAIGYLTKPASRQDLTRMIDALMPRAPARSCRVLIIEDDAVLSDSLLSLLREEGFEAQRATSASEARAILERERFQCLVLDLGLPDIDGLDLLQELVEQHAEMPSVVVYTGRALSKAELARIHAYTASVVLKEGPAQERVMDELRLFARRLKDARPGRRSAPAPAGPALGGRKILIADDDMRAVYAMSALLRAKGAQPLVADTGKVALEVLSAHPEIEAVLMDIMMPEMDGYEAMRRIRLDPRFARLPVIALTAKAMKVDLQKCLDAGATGYVAKPVDAELLFGMLQSTLGQGARHGA